MRRFYALSAIAVSVLVVFGTNSSFAQSVGIAGSVITPDPQSILDIRSTAKGALLPRMTSGQRDAIAVAASQDKGLTIYNLTTGNYNYWDGTTWQQLPTSSSIVHNTLDGAYNEGGSGAGRIIVANAGAVNIQGTGGLLVNGNVGIGTGSPAAKLDVQGLMVGGFGAQTTAGTLDWNDVTNARSGSGYSLLHGNATNGPGPSTYFHPFGFEYNSKNGSGNITQLAIPYGGTSDMSSGLYMRGRYSGTWSNWMRIIAENNSGNVGIGTISPTAQLHTTGTVRFANLTNGLLKVDGNGNVSVSTGSGLFAAGTGLSWAGNTLNSVWTQIGNDIYRNNSGNVGIGTTAPVRNLQIADPAGASLMLMHSGGNVTSQGDMTGQILFDSDDDSAPTSADVDASAVIRGYVAEPSGHGNSNKGGDLAFLTKANSTAATAVATERMRITQNGNVGIGTTSPGGKIDVAGVALANAYRTRAGSTDYHHLVRNGGGAAVYINQESALGSFPILRLSSGTATPNTNVRFTVENNGNVGIGTTSPAQALHVVGNARISGLASTNRLVYANASGDLLSSTSTVNANNLVDGSGTLNYLARWTDSNTLSTGATRDNGSAVGIGVAPTARTLTVNGDVLTNGGSFISSDASASNVDHIWNDDGNNSGTGNGAGTWNFVNDAAEGTLGNAGIRGGNLFMANSGNVNYFAGNVGIGTTSPFSKLDIAATTATMSLSSSGSIDLYLEGSSANNKIDSRRTNDLLFQINSVTKMTLQGATGNVGIGTTSPGARLDIGGNSQSGPRISARGSGAPSFEFGHTNQAGYGSTIGATEPSGSPYLAFNAESESTGNTFKTRGKVGRIISSNLSGGVLFSRATNANAGGQSLTTDVTIDGSGNVNIANLAINSAVYTDGSRNLTTSTPSSGNLGYWTRSGTSLYNTTLADNVGIGTASPGSYKLNVAGSINATNSGVSIFRHNNTNPANYGLDEYAENGVEKAYVGMGGSTQSFGANAAYSQDGFSINMDGAGVMNISNRGAQKTIYLNTGAEGNADFHSLTVKSGKVGIGTTVPKSLLHVSGTQSYGSLRISPTGANGESAMAFFTDAAGTDNNDAWVIGHAGWGNTGDFVIGNENNGAGGNVRLLIEKSGNVGIGTTSPAQKLHVVGNGRFTSMAGSGVRNLSVNASGDLTTSQPTSGASGFWTRSGTDLYNTALTDNVGIGTNNPSAKLEVYGNLHINKASTPVLRFQEAGVDKWGLIQNYSSTGGLSFYSYAATSPGTKIEFTKEGNVGIGATSPGARLDVYSPSNAGIRYSGIRTHRPASFGQYAFMDYAYSSSAAYFGSVYTGSTGVYGSIHFRQYTQGNAFRDAMNIISSGNVGIGTTGPDAPLQVGTGNNSLRLGYWSSANADIDGLLPGSTFGSLIQSGDNGHIVVGIRGNDAADAFSIVSGSGNYMTDHTYDKVILYANATGNVGIGTTAPAQKLHVIGNGRFSSMAGSGIRNLSVNASGDLTTSQPTSGASGFWTRNGGDLYPSAVADYVGVGTTNPAYDLDVSGLIRLSTNVGINTTPRTDAYRLSMGGAIHMNNNPMDYVSQVHFNDNVRFYDDNNNNYLNFKYGNTGAGGIKILDGNSILQGYLYADGNNTNPSFGLLDGDGNWAVHIRKDDYLTFLINNSEKVRIISNGNVGIGTTTPGEKLDVSGNIKATGVVYWGNGLTRTETLNDAGLQGNAGARSGFFETSAPSPGTDWYPGASSWQHLLSIRHNNNTNNYSMQFAGSFFDQNLWFRKTNNNPAQAWSRILTTNDISTMSGVTNYLARWTSATALGTGTTYDNGTNVGIGTTAPAQKLDVNGSVRIRGGSPNPGDVLTASNTSGDATWQKPGYGEYNSGSVTAGNWYRIASNTGNRANAMFTLRDFISGGGHSTMQFRVGTSFNYASGMSFTLISHSIFGAATFTKVRILSKSTYDPQYIEVYVQRTGSVDYSITDNLQSAGFVPVDWTGGSIPSGYSSREFDVDKLFVVGDYDDRFTIARGGNVGIGTTNPTYKLQVMGRLKTTGINETSDIRLKKNISPIDHALENVIRMDGVTYNWRKDEFPEQNFTDDLQYGLIAQDLEKIIPGLVETDSEGWKSIEYTHLVPVLIEAIKEQQRIISGQSKDISELKAQATDSQEKIDRLFEILNGYSSK